MPNCKWDPTKHNGKPCPFHSVRILDGKPQFYSKQKGWFDISKEKYDGLKSSHREYFDNEVDEEDFDLEKENKIIECKNYIKSGALPKGVKPQEFLGGTMDTNGNKIDMSKFKDGFLVSCGNASFEENKEFMLNSDFIKEFLEYSDDGELYIGSWFENGKNTNEPTIWVKDKEEAIKLAKLTGQYSITDCKEYNKHGCKNYELLTEEQWDYTDDIFIPICNTEEHQIKLEGVEFNG